MRGTHFVASFPRIRIATQHWRFVSSISMIRCMSKNLGIDAIQPRRVGILGGMGPAATVDLVNKIIVHTPASRDQDHVPLVIWNVPQIPARSAAILSNRAPSPLCAMIDAATGLVSAGAETIAIACNTAHHWAREIECAAGVPLLHIADAAIDDAITRGAFASRVMLLATSGTCRSKFYEHIAAQRGLNLERCDSDMQIDIDRAIEDVKAGRIELASKLLIPRVAELYAAGVETFVLACTELPLLSRRLPSKAHYIDATDSLARMVVRYSLRLQVPRKSDA
jgi:aspartate racemase